MHGDVCTRGPPFLVGAEGWGAREGGVCALLEKYLHLIAEKRNK
jgi:hypothetical protein